MALNIKFSSRQRASVRAEAFEAKLTALADSVAGRFARGNVALQQGYVVTRDQLDKEREELRDFIASR